MKSRKRSTKRDEASVGRGERRGRKRRGNRKKK
jgi:hypothetical protein